MFIRFFKYLKYKFFFKKQIYKKIKENSISYIDFEYETSDIRVR
jgi:hypothetical protein